MSRFEILQPVKCGFVVLCQLAYFRLYATTLGEAGRLQVSNLFETPQKYLDNGQNAVGELVDGKDFPSDTLRSMFERLP